MVSKVTTLSSAPVLAGAPSPAAARASDCPADRRARASASAAALARSEKGVSAGAGAWCGTSAIPRLITSMAVSKKTAYRKYRLRALISVLSSFTTDHVVTPDGKPGAPLRPENR
jgi:hypothetical protein